MHSELLHLYFQYNPTSPDLNYTDQYAFSKCMKVTFYLAPVKTRLRKELFVKLSEGLCLRASSLYLMC
jgi:hypothetical protein